MVCFLRAAFRHASDLLSGGWLPYIYVTLPINLFWSSLTLFDPLAAVLLWRRPRAGAVLALLIMLSDVGVNTFVAAHTERQNSLGLLTLVAQMQFLGVLIGGSSLLWSLSPWPAARKR